MLISPMLFLDPWVMSHPVGSLRTRQFMIMIFSVSKPEQPFFADKNMVTQDLAGLQRDFEFGDQLFI